jgi:hypothetical protein
LMPVLKGLQRRPDLFVDLCRRMDDAYCLGWQPGLEAHANGEAALFELLVVSGHTESEVVTAMPVLNASAAVRRSGARSHFDPRAQRSIDVLTRAARTGDTTGTVIATMTAAESSARLPGSGRGSVGRRMKREIERALLGRPSADELVRWKSFLLDMCGSEAVARDVGSRAVAPPIIERLEDFDVERARLVIQVIEACDIPSEEMRKLNALVAVIAASHSAETELHRRLAPAFWFVRGTAQSIPDPGMFPVSPTTLSEAEARATRRNRSVSQAMLDNYFFHSDGIVGAAAVPDYNARVIRSCMDMNGLEPPLDAVIRAALHVRDATIAESLVRAALDGPDASLWLADGRVGQLIRDDPDALHGSLLAFASIMPAIGAAPTDLERPNGLTRPWPTVS